MLGWKWIGAAGAALLALGLSSCVDVDMKVAVLGKDKAKVETAMAMDLAMYQMTQKQDGAEDFCEDGTLKLTEDQAICVETVEGDFATVTPPGEPGEPQARIAAVGPKSVRVSFPTGTLKGEFGGGAEEDEQTQQVMKAMFAGHALTLSVTGNTISDTNMQLSDDGKTASLRIPFDDLLAGKVELPAESYAVVELP